MNSVGSGRSAAGLPAPVVARSSPAACFVRVLERRAQSRFDGQFLAAEETDLIEPEGTATDDRIVVVSTCQEFLLGMLAACLGGTASNRCLSMDLESERVSTLDCRHTSLCNADVSELA